MDQFFTILIADKNRNVREFLRREFSVAGFQIELAKDGIELIEIINNEPPPDLLICDLEMPFSNGVETLEQLQQLRPMLPVIIYTFLTEHAGHKAIMRVAAFLEKTGDDVENLKKAVRKALKQTYPERYSNRGYDEAGSASTEPGQEAI